ncbi:MAG: hypothetical protein ACRYFS_02465 [Janthinobacterium lividum]
MSPTLSRFLIVTAAFLISSSVRAQTPEGPQLPPPDNQISAVHGQVRLGYYLTTHTFRYHGEYEVATNFTRLAGSPIYVFGDVDVEALEDSAHGKFQPDRLVGTFEVGARRFLGIAPLSLLVRHQSAHYIDRDDLFQGSWDMTGLRYEKTFKSTLVSATLAQYVHVHQLASEYHQDVDLQSVTSLGAFRGHPLDLHTDVHAATGSGGKGGYTDFWIEPGISLSRQTVFFLGYGQIHDTNLSAANTDHPVITGIRLVY